MHCASEIFEGIFRHENTSLAHIDELNFYRILRYVALLHDIGHIAFSHALEDSILSPFKHEDVSQYIIRHDPGISEILEEYTELVASLLSKNYKEKYAILHEIISGQLDADRADYLLRDSYLCGVKYGEYDFERYKQSFAAIEDGHLKLCIKERDIFVMEAFLLARYHYNLQVPFHRTRVGYDIVLTKFFETIKDEEKDIQNLVQKDNQELKIDLERFELFDDYYIWELIKKYYKKGNRWASMLLRQDHLIPLFDSNSYANRAEEMLKKLKETLLNEGFSENEEFFVYKKQVELTKISKEKENNILVLLDETKQKIEIDEYSDTIASLKKPLTIYRLYIIPQIKQEAKKIKEKLF